MSTPENIILCGFMGTGKTTVGKLLAAQLGWRFVDTDDLIAAQLGGRSIKQIFAEDGEPFFRMWESRICDELAWSSRHVIATGGGAVLNPANRDALNRAGMVVCLEASPDEIVTRLAGVTDRPLLTGADPRVRVRELLAARAGAYGALPFHVNTSGCSPEEVSGRIITLWGQYCAHP
jgi:shikimate kinase